MGEDKLSVRWSKREKDFVITYPFGRGTKSDGHWLSSVISDEFQRELIRRGYDVTTLRLSVAADLKSPPANDKFPSLVAASMPDPTP